MAPHEWLWHARFVFVSVAACAPSDKFLYMGGPLAMGLGVVLVSSIGSAFMPPTTALGAGMYSIALYGGLILFGGFLLYDTQKIMHRAEHHPPMMAGVRQYDPINASIGIYMDTMNIFIRIAQILAMSGGSRRKWTSLTSFSQRLTWLWLGMFEMSVALFPTDSPHQL